ncbi:MAG TPA: DUF2147 domain-containing protein [Xanthobacteraceae bacterium]|jgi:uncharacterized protein (DUF2147 family)|nr:DUF2147 domain-containing protein [Xanthobacteraceae bacterium]
MRSIPVIWGATFLLTGVAAAGEPQPTGEWRTADGRANVRIDDCDGALWGIISWEKEPGGVDEYNPDPAERSRATLGLHILRAMKPTKPGLWQGEVYNPENGKTYDSRISLTSPDVLRIEGCVLGFLCGGENWTRIRATERAAPQPQPRAPGPQRAGRPKEAPPPMPSASATPPACSGIAEGAGAAHKGGLK